jgi:hypothetical protein
MKNTYKWKIYQTYAKKNNLKLLLNNFKTFTTISIKINLIVYLLRFRTTWDLILLLVD